MKRLFLLLATLTLTLVACDTTTTEPAPLPTLATETLADPLPLENTYTADLMNATITMQYPADWVAVSEFADLGVIISSSPDLVDVSFDTVILSGQVYIDIVYAPKNLEVMTNTTPELVLASLLPTFERDDSTVTAQPIISATMTDRLAAYSVLTSDDGGEGIQIVIDSGDAYAVLVAVFAGGERTQYQATVEAIAGSIDYTFDSNNTVESTPEVTAEATAEVTADVEVTAEATETSD